MSNNSGKMWPEQQKEFMEVCKQYSCPPKEVLTTHVDLHYRRTVALWTSLINEEVNTELRSHIADYILHPIPIPKKPEEVIKELAEIGDDIVDSIYVLCGLGNAMGLPITRIWNAVHSANLDKAPGGTVLLREDGKILKPPGWAPANIIGIIEEELGQG